MRKQLFIFVSFLGFLTACQSGKEKQENNPQENTAEASLNNSSTATEENNPAQPRKFSTKSGKSISIEEAHPVGMSLSDITIKGEGFTDSMIVIKDADPISNVLEGDLDGDGYGEWYIITTNAGSGSYGNVIGVANSKDKSLKQITIGEFNGGEEYTGHDVFSIEGDYLIRNYPVNKNQEKTSEAKGAEKTISYSLRMNKKGEYQLIQNK